MKTQKKPKVPYLQYEILEFLHNGVTENVELLVGYKPGSLIVKNAFEALEKKGMLDNEGNLTEYATELVTKHYPNRHTLQSYTLEQLSLQKKKNQEEIFTSEAIKGNGSDAVFRWYKYLEDFPSTFVKDSLQKYKISDDYFVLDPFVGSGTTLIQAKIEGYKSLGTDINPVMVFVANQKLNWELSAKDVKKTYHRLVSEYLKATNNTFKTSLEKSKLNNMPKKELNQWLSPIKQAEVAHMSNLIDKIKNKQLKGIFKFILTRTAVDISYVAFCPGTTFYPFRNKPDFTPHFRDIVAMVAEDLQKSHIVKSKGVQAEVILGNTKEKDFLSSYKNKVDLIITSPPYPNDLEYTRQTRLELYLLDIVTSMKDVQGIKKGMVKGSTKLIYQGDSPESEILNLRSLKSLTKRIRHKLKDKNWGFDYPKMVEMYFTDMYKSLKNYHDIMVPGGTAILVVGDQTIAGEVIPVAKILAEIAKNIGFSHAHIEHHRDRRSTTHDIPIPEENLILKK